MNPYDDIINLKHHTSLKHPRMDIYKRSAQFAPFAALTGYSNIIKEEARITKSKKELSNEKKLILNEKLKYINNHLMDKKEVTVIYYVPDKRKKGGAYLNKKSIIKKIDLYNRQIFFIDKFKILIDNIFDIFYE